MAPDGSVYVAWTDSTDDDSFKGAGEIYVARSTDKGATFGSPVNASTFNEIAYRPRNAFFRFWASQFPQLAIGPAGEVYISYAAKPSDRPRDDSDIWLVKSTDDGQTWDRAIRLNDDDTAAPQFFPSIDVSPDGTVHAMWGDMRDDLAQSRFNIYYTQSKDGGETWGFEIPDLDAREGDTRVTDFGSNPNRGFPGGRFLGDYFSLQATDEDVYMVWSDTRLGEYGAPNMKIGFARQRAIPGPELFLSPPSGPGGQQVTLQGFGYQPDMNVFVQLGDSTIAMARTDETGDFSNVFYMPITSEGSQDVTAVDESGNRQSTSYFTEFGFGNIADVVEDLSAPDRRPAAAVGASGRLTGTRGVPGPMTRPMRRTTPRMLAALALSGGLAIIGASVSVAQDSSDQTGPAADRVLFNSVFVDRAPLELQAGTIDMYLYGLKTEAAQELQGADGVELFQAPATTLSLILNPAPAPEGRLNPFSIPEVRRAVQYLVNREFIAQDFYGGLAMPMITHVSPSDYDFLTVYDIDRGSGIRYDPEYARQQISDAMIAAGAELSGDPGVWSFGGEPIRLKFIARPEDERRQIGDLVRAELEQAGFLVSMSYKDFAPAVTAVYSTDPQAFEWHLYTEGWSRGSAQRYDSSTVNSMNAPWLGNMPGWREQGFWQYQNEELDTLGQRLYRGEFDSLEERNEIYRQMTAHGPRRVDQDLAGQRPQHLPGDLRAHRRDPGHRGRSANPVHAARGVHPGQGRSAGRQPVGLDRAHHVQPSRWLW